MNRLLILFAFISVLVGVAPIASATGITATDAVWQINSSADTPVGADTNGGVWDVGNKGATGTDHSQIAGTALTVTTAGSTSIVITSGSADNTMLGNGINIASDNIYIIVGFTDSTHVTVDRNTGTAVGSSAVVGGPMATLISIYPATNVGYTGNTVYWHGGTYTLTSAETINIVGATGSIVNIVGYTSNRNITNPDGGVTITTATNSTNLFVIKGIYFVWSGCTFTNTAGTHAECFNANGNIGNTGLAKWVNCYWNGTFTKIFDLTGVNSYTLYFDTCGLTAWSTKGIDMSRGGILYMKNTWLTGGTGDAIYANNAGNIAFFLERTVIANNSGYGVNCAATGNAINGFQVIACIIYKNTSGGIYNAATATVFGGNPVILDNSIIYGNGTYGINSQDTTLPFLAFQNNNALGGNTTANYNNFPTGASDIALTVDPFVAGVSGNFKLNSTAGGGALLQALGWPQLTSGQANAPDVGAIQGTSIQSASSPGHIGGGLSGLDIQLDEDRIRRAA